MHVAHHFYLPYNNKISDVMRMHFDWLSQIYICVVV